MTSVRTTASIAALPLALILTVSPALATTAAAGPPAPGMFVGHWHSHDTAMDITSTTATITKSLGPCSLSPDRLCHETDQLAVRSGDGTQLELVVTSVGYADNTGAPVPDPPGPATQVGDSVRLVSQAPGLLKVTVQHGFPNGPGTTPYFCGAGVGQSDGQLCGA